MNRIKLSGRTTVQALVCMALLLAFALMANAQTFVSNPTTTTLWAGTADYIQFGLASLTAPASGVILSGTAISAITGKPVRHLWYGDLSNGLCRVDPELDQIIAPVNGIGGHFNVITTCVGSIGAAAFTPGQIAFDPTTNTMYSEDTGRTTAGIIRLQYIPSGDNGQGTLNPISVTSLVGTQGTRNAAGGCPQVKDPATGTLVPVVPNSAALGPDGNLYTGSIRDGALVKIISPATFNPATDCAGGGGTGVTPGPNDKDQIPILSADERVGSGHTFGLGFIGTTLLGADNIAPWVLFNATQCFTPINGNRICGSPPLGGAAPAPTEILGTVAPAPQAAAITDAQFPTFTGNSAYFAAFPSLVKVSNITSVSNMTVQTNYGGAFSFITGLTADPADTVHADLYVGSDSSQGSINGAGSIWLVAAQTQACAPAAPLAPSSVSAADSTTLSLAANVSWVPTSSCNATSNYVVRTLLSTGAASGVADLTVTAPATSAVVTGLTAGASYVFEVEACNATGCSPFSPISNVITAQALTAPPAPTNVSGLDAGTGTSATIAWSQLSNGGSTITSSTIRSFLAGVLVSTNTVTGSATGGTATGLTCGNSYTFTVAATNIFGTSPQSAPSLPVSIACQTAADVSVTESVTSPVNAGSIVPFTIKVSNGGPASAAIVTLSDTLPAPLSSFTTTQGACTGTVGLTAFSCNLGSMAAGASATVTVSVQLPSPTTQTSFTNTVTVSALSSTGTNIDPNLANNTASATVTTTTSSGTTCSTSTVDIQVGGSAQNGNPTHGTPDVFTWQIKNNTGNQTANCVTFTASTTAPTGAVLAVNSTSPGSPTCSFTTTTVSCTLGNIPGGQTATVSITATPSAAEPANSYSMTGNAQLGTGSTDSNPANNTFTVFIGAQ